jgi:hypothetical protein
VFSPRLDQFWISANHNSIFYEFDRRDGTLSYCVADRHRQPHRRVAEWTASAYSIALFGAGKRNFRTSRTSWCDLTN